MRLTPAETKKLIRECEGEPIKSVIDDACEALTIKVVMLVKQKRALAKAALNALAPGSKRRAAQAAWVNALGRIMVDISEAP